MEGADAGPSKLRLEAGEHPGKFGFQPVKGLDHTNAGRGEHGAAAGTAARTGLEQRLPEQIRHSVEGIPGRLVAQAHRLRACRDAAATRHSLEQPDTLPSDGRHLLTLQRNRGFNCHE
jgi:hypothetical protein